MKVKDLLSLLKDCYDPEDFIAWDFWNKNDVLKIQKQSFPSTLLSDEDVDEILLKIDSQISKRNEGIWALIGREIYCISVGQESDEKVHR